MSENSKGNILVVDDNPANLRLLAGMLSEHGYRVRPVPSGELALRAARAAAPDLILLDITMPRMSGYEVCEALKADELLRDIPIIFISALDETLDKVKAFTVGGVDYITKPFQFEEVLVRLETHLSLRSLQRQLERANQHLEQRVEARTAELSALNRAYERFVPREFTSFLDKRSITDVDLGDQVQRDMTIMFADIRDFTTLSETLTPQQNFAFINEYLERVSPIIRRHGGFVDQYMGDGIMALFPNTPEDAVRAGIELGKEVTRYNVERVAGGHRAIAVGIGIHTGSLMLGIVGEAKRLQGTVISDAVNLASRLESLSKHYGISLVVSARVIAHLGEPPRHNYRFIDCVRVKGKKRPVSVFEVFDGEPPDVAAWKQRTKPDFEAGIHLYREQRFEDAGAKFAHVLDVHPEDQTARLYLERTRLYRDNGVPADWIAVADLKEK